VNDANKVGAIGKIPIMEKETHALLMRVHIEVVDAVGVKKARTPLDAVHLVALAEQKSARYAPSWPVIPVMRAFIDVVIYGSW